MKNIIVIAFLMFSIAGIAQDKIVKKTGEIIECEVTEVGVEEVKYYYPNKPKVVFGIDKGLISQIKFATGEVIDIYSDNFSNPDFYADQNIHALKVNFLSPLMGSMEFVYEQSIKPGKSWEAALGVVGLGFDPQEYNPAGAYGKFAFKFIRTPDFYVNRMRYAHILKGAYFAPELALRYMKFDGYNYNYSYDYSYYEQGKMRKEDFSLAIMLKFGKQWVLDDSFIVDLYCGIGYGYTSSEDELNYGFVTFDSSTPIAITGGLRIGWAF